MQIYFLGYFLLIFPLILLTKSFVMFILSVLFLYFQSNQANKVWILKGHSQEEISPSLIAALKSLKSERDIPPKHPTLKY